jgi:choline dehydrogenase-like flavoprotein
LDERLSWTFRQWRQQLGEEPLEAVVIGSGYGGGVAALRLARELKLAVTVMERGSEYVPGDFPNDLSLVPSHMRLPNSDGDNVKGRPNALFDWRIGENVAALVANGVGGGSLINGGVVLRPERDVIEQPAWPAELRKPAALEPWFQRAEAGLHAEQWPAE